MSEINQADLIHDDFVPQDIREGDPIAASVRHGNKNLQVDLWSISPIGAEFLWPHEKLEVGEILDIVIYINKKNIHFNGISVCNFQEKNGRHLVGVRWVNGTPAPSQTNRETRWSSSDLYAPTVVCANPILFDEVVLFRVINISASGALLHTSMRNKAIIPGMLIDGTWSFPMTGSCSAEFRVVWVKLTSVNGLQCLAVGIHFMKKMRELNNISGEYILQFGNVDSVEDLRNSKLNIKNAKRSIVVNFSKTQEDYQQVIELRRIAYKKYSDDEITEMSDKFDSTARILTARYKGKIIGTLRMIFHKHDETLEVGDYIQLPIDFPKNHELVEVSRLAVHPDFQLSSVVLDLQRQCYLTMLQTKRQYLVGSAPDHLCESYRRMGVQIMKDLHFSPKSCPGLKLNLIKMDLYEVLCNPDKVGLVMWNKMYDDLLTFAEKHGIIEMSKLQRMSAGIYRMMKVFT